MEIHLSRVINFNIAYHYIVASILVRRGKIQHQKQNHEVPYNTVVRAADVDWLTVSVSLSWKFTKNEMNIEFPALIISIKRWNVEPLKGELYLL